MYLTQTNIIRGLSASDYRQLRTLCSYANNMYNVALYNIRQYYFQEKKFLTYESNYHVCKTNENYRLLQAGVAQQILKVADRSFKSFFNLIKKSRSGEYRFQDIRMPRYRTRGGMFNLILSTNAISITNGYLIVPVSNAYRRQGHRRIRIPFPARLENKKIKEVRILPSYSCFKIQYVYEFTPQVCTVDTNNALAIDIGVDNLASCVSTVGTSFLMDGRKLKSINQRWNKQKARLQSVAMKQGLRTTKRIGRLTAKRNNRVKDCIRKTARYIVNHCLTHDIGTIVCGYNLDFKRKSNLGKQINQQFTQISFGDFRQALQSLCEQYSLHYVEQEESYTSKASYLDNDKIPVYNPECKNTYVFSGKRIKRGLYRSANGTIINADLNGAANILRKSKQNLRELCSGLLASPRRIRIF